MFKVSVPFPTPSPFPRLWKEKMMRMPPTSTLRTLLTSPFQVLCTFIHIVLNVLYFTLRCVLVVFLFPFRLFVAWIRFLMRLALRVLRFPISLLTKLALSCVFAFGRGSTYLGMCATSFLNRRRYASEIRAFEVRCGEGDPPREFNRYDTQKNSKLHKLGTCFRNPTREEI